MNVQTLCLGILSFADMTGYDIRKMASEGNFSHFCEASFGSIYPALSQLTQKNYATFTQEILPGKPSRKIYAITDEGRSYLYKTLQDDPSPDRCQSEFLFHSLFADHIPPLAVPQTSGSQNRRNCRKTRSINISPGTVRPRTKPICHRLWSDHKPGKT